MYTGLNTDYYSVRPQDNYGSDSNKIREEVDGEIGLWKAVILRTIKDLGYLKRMEGKEELKPGQAKKIRLINEEVPPDEFVDGDRFEEICHLLRLDPQEVREGIDLLLEDPDTIEKKLRIA